MNMKDGGLKRGFWIEQTQHLRQLVKYLGLVFVIYTLLRILFLLINHVYFFPADESVPKALLAGLRFDLSTIIYVNSLLILSFLIPLDIRNNPNYRKIQQWIFTITNGLAIVLELASIAYFPYTNRRMISSDFDLWKSSSEATFQYIIDYWYLIFLGLSSFLFLYWIYRKMDQRKIVHRLNTGSQSVIGLIALIGLVIAMRGGIQQRPLTPISTASYGQSPRWTTLVSNNVFNLIFSFGQKQLQEKKYFSQQQLDTIFQTTHYPDSNEAFNPENVVIIILESFGKEIVGHYHPDQVSNTPFLDSLIRSSYHTSQGFANGTRSVQGIASILSSIPALMEAPFIFSPYQGNHIDGIAALLKPKGYQSAFFHGANPGSMEMETFATLSGFDHYYDREDYGDQDYDGNWGIWDIPFFKYTAKKIDNLPEPFVTTLFSLTSHHPYKTETYWEDKYPDLDPVSRSIRYTDEALRSFFDIARQSDWFDRTLFVITADHTGPSTNPIYAMPIGFYRIPILFHHPQKQLTGDTSRLIQQIDLLPTVFDLLNYDQPYQAFGISAFDTLKQPYAYAYGWNRYQIFNQQYTMLFNGTQVMDVFDLHQDPLMKNNLYRKSNPEFKVLENQIKAVIQRYNEAMIYNKLSKSDH